MKKLSHIKKDGTMNMVDVSDKNPMLREAWAEGSISMIPAVVKMIKENTMKKGDVLAAARIAGIQASKKTSDLIPLCHPLSLTKVDVAITINKNKLIVQTYAKCIGNTGVEMEALTAASVALLTIYDMCKAVDKRMVISDIKLNKKVKKEIAE